MEKKQEIPSSVVLSQTKGDNEKVLLNINYKSAIRFICMMLFSSVSIFSAMAPFGIAAYAAFFVKSSWLVNFLVFSISSILFLPDNAFLYIAVVMLITALLAVLDFEIKGLKRPIYASVSLSVIKLFYIFMSDYVMYDIFALVIECALAFFATYIFERSIPLLSSLKERTMISSAESVCVMGFFAVLSLSLARFPQVYGFNISNVFSVLVIYIFCLGGINGGAVIMAVLFGAVSSLETEMFSLLTSGLAFGALVGAVFHIWGKCGIVLGFVIANTASSLLLSADAVQLGGVLYDSVAAGVIFMLIPTRFCTGLSNMMMKSYKINASLNLEYNSAEKSIRSRLLEMSHSFSELSDVYVKATPEREIGKEYIINKFENLISLACIGCPNKRKCFASGTVSGYKQLYSMLETAFRRGRLTVASMPAGFTSVCHRCDSFCEKFNTMFAVIKTEKMWLSKMNDSRQLISEQLYAISKSLEYEEKKCDFKKDFHLEEKLWAKFDKSGFSPCDISAKRDINGEICISVSFKECDLKPNMCDNVRNIVSEISSEKLVYPTVKRHKDSITYSFFSANNYSVSVGYASKCKSDENISGDSFDIINTDDNRVSVIISDGMGSGASAAKESKLSVDLMNKFIKAGFTSDTAVRLINSSLLLKSSRDSFTTIDMCTVDLKEASLRFIKLGAAASYIKSDNKVISVKGSGLPVGILRDVEIEKHMISIEGDTVVIMMSDGITDIALKDNTMQGWIEKLILETDTTNPQIMASKLMEKAVNLQSGKAHDDMTILVINIRKV